MTWRRAVAVSIVVLAAAALAYLSWPAGAGDSGAVQVGGSSAAGESAYAVPAVLNAVLNAPLPASKGELRIRGQVVDGQAPVAGAHVTATRGAADDTLSEMPCDCGNSCGRKLLDCGCPEAAGQMVSLVRRVHAARRRVG